MSDATSRMRDAPLIPPEGVRMYAKLSGLPVWTVTRACVSAAHESNLDSDYETRCPCPARIILRAAESPSPSIRTQPGARREAAHSLSREAPQLAVYMQDQVSLLTAMARTSIRFLLCRIPIIDLIGNQHGSCHTRSSPALTPFGGSSAGVGRA